MDSVGHTGTAMRVDSVGYTGTAMGVDSVGYTGAAVGGELMSGLSGIHWHCYERGTDEWTQWDTLALL